MRLNFFILKFISLPEKPKSSRGFTLTELLIAASLTLVVIGAAGFGLYQTMRGSKTGNNQAERRSEIARAYEFISDEMRRARLIEDDSNIATDAPDFNATGKDVVLALKIPVSDPTTVDFDGDGDANDEANVIYYVSNPPFGSVWQGPKVLYRWGPPIGDNGEYTDNNWQEKPLIDQLSDDPTKTVSSCPTGWTLSPNPAIPGFAACINPEGKVAQIYLNGEIVTAEGDETYQGNTTTAARANDQTAINITSLDKRIYSLGGEFKCQSSGTSIGVDTNLKFYTNATDTTSASTETIKSGGSSKTQVNQGDKITVSSIPTGCTASATPYQSTSEVGIDITINSSTPITTVGTAPNTISYPNFTNTTNSKVKIFKNGDDAPTDTAYDGQQTLRQYLESKGVEFEDIDGDGTDEIVLNYNHLLVVFEIGQDDPDFNDDGTVDNPGWDFQDNLVLINVNATQP